MRPMATRRFLRDVLARALSAIPVAWLEPLRRRYAAAHSGGAEQRALEAVFRVLRYRHLDASIETFSLPDTPDVVFYNTNSLIVRSVYWSGRDGYEACENRLWSELCARSSGILEIGAHIGFYTVLGGRAAGDTAYTAVEAHPTTAKILRGNLRLNALDRIEVVESAVVGEKRQETLNLMVPDSNDEAAPSACFVEGRSELSSLASARSATVGVVEARELIAEGTDLIKVDAEGMEYDILSGIREFLVAKRPTLLLEALAESVELRGLLGALCESAYTLNVCVPNGLQPVRLADLSGDSLESRFRTRDVVLTPTAPPGASPHGPF